jgi:hypothetical protein
MRKLIFFSSLFFTLAVPSLLGQTDPKIIFDSIQNQTRWKPGSEARSYDSKTLSSYQSKVAPIFEEYGFNRLDRQEFRQGGSTIVVEIYEMVDPTAAYGAFTFFRSKDFRILKDFGTLAEEQGFKLSFVQNSDYVRVSSSPRSFALQPALLEIGHIISQNLPRKLSVPAIVKRLPKEDMVEHSDVFILGPQALNQKVRFGGKDLFGLSNGAEAVLAQYQFTGDSATMLLIYYPTQQLAKKFLESGYREYVAQNPNESVFFKREGPLVILVLGSKSAEMATTLLDKVSYVSTVSWDPKAQPLSVGQMMLNIFTYIGIMLALTLGAGLVFGFLRIILKRMFPNRIFDRSRDTEIIRLNLPNPRH